jgi:hypothetical protein
MMDRIHYILFLKSQMLIRDYIKGYNKSHGAIKYSCIIPCIPLVKHTGEVLART